MNVEIPFIPYRRVTILSEEDSSQFVSKLAEVTLHIRPWFKHAPKGVQFIGKVNSDTFRLAPFIRGRNTYLPWLLGRVHSDARGTSISITMTLHPIAMFAMLFFIIWAQYLAMVYEGQFNIGLLVAMLIFHVVMYLIGFLPEALQAEEQLLALASKTKRKVQKVETA